MRLKPRSDSPPIQIGRDAIVDHHTVLIVGSLLRMTGERLPW